MHLQVMYARTPSRCAGYPQWILRPGRPWKTPSASSRTQRNGAIAPPSCEIPLPEATPRLPGHLLIRKHHGHSRRAGAHVCCHNGPPDPGQWRQVLEPHPWSRARLQVEGGCCGSPVGVQRGLDPKMLPQVGPQHWAPEFCLTTQHLLGGGLTPPHPLGPPPPLK